jgi:hypothetical protein
MSTDVFDLHAATPHPPGAERAERADGAVEIEVTLVLKPHALPDGHPDGVRGFLQEREALAREVVQS